MNTEKTSGVREARYEMMNMMHIGGWWERVYNPQRTDAHCSSTDDLSAQP